MTAMVFGLGLSGIGAAGLALRLGYRTFATDRMGLDRLPPEARELAGAGMKFVDGRQAESLLGETDLMVVSPGIPKSDPLIRKASELGVRMAGEIEFAFSNSRGRVIGITGSNGKSTTTSLTYSIMSSFRRDVRLGGNIGTPFSGILEGASDDTTFVLELSSFQLEDVFTFKPAVAVFLNLSPDHQDRYGSFEEYSAAKARIFENQDGTDCAVLNLDDALVAELACKTRGRKFFFSLASHSLPGAFASGGTVFFRSEDGAVEELFSERDLSIRGPHNLANAMAASIACLVSGASPGDVRAAVSGFRALPHRLELVAEIGGALYYNDSKATNTDSVLKALLSFDSGVVLMLGGKDKGADFSVLKEEAAKRCRKVVAFGGAGRKVFEEFRGTVETELYGTLEEAVPAVMAGAGKGDVVLLSPACASFDEFKNFEDRGDKFRAWVNSGRVG